MWCNRADIYKEKNEAEDCMEWKYVYFHKKWNQSSKLQSTKLKTSQLSNPKGQK